MIELRFLCLPSFFFPQALILLPCVLPRVGKQWLLEVNAVFRE